MECIPDPSSYQLTSETGVQKTILKPWGLEGMLRPFSFYIPNGSEVAYYIFPDGAMVAFRAVVTPLNINVSKKENAAHPYRDWYIDRASGRYREVLSWIGYKESTSGICSGQQTPTNRKF